MLRLPHPLSTVRCLPFSAGAVLFWPEGERVWVLNESAAFIWHLLAADEEIPDPATALSQYFSIPVEDAQVGINEALTGFAAEGLLEGGCPKRIPAQGDEWDISITELKLLEPESWIFESHFALAEETFSLCSQDPSLGKGFADLLQPLFSSSPCSQVATTCLAVSRNDAAGGGWNIYLDGQLCFKDLVRDAVLPCLMTLTFVRVCAALQEYLLLHAAVLVRNGKALLLPAQAGSGKTTLAAELAARGWTFFGDELALIDPVTARVAALPLPMSIKTGSVQPLQSSYPDLADLPVWDRTDGQQVRYALPPLASLPDLGQTAVVEKMVFPCYQPDGVNTLEPLVKSAALQYLSGTGSSNRRLTEADVKAMIALVDEADCYQLTYRESSTAVELLEAFCASD